MKYSLSDFTLDEKMKLLSGKDFWHLHDLDGKVYSVLCMDGPHGVRRISEPEWEIETGANSVAFPSLCVLGQTFNEELAGEMGEALADECIDEGVDILLAPGCNIHRSPLCGRNFEYFSEDPYLSGVFAREYIKGLQSKGVGACLKHYCLNNSEMGRVWTSSEADERTMREIYLEAFRIATEADPLSVMSSYNLVNGVRMSENKTLYNLLRGEFWREDGVIFSDWAAVQDEVASVKAGLDIKMPHQSYEVLRRAYDEGKITEKEIDECAKRVLLLIEKCENNLAKRGKTSPKHERYKAAEKIAREGIVLLKNNGVLPLKGDADILITGIKPDLYVSGGGSSNLTPDYTPKTLDVAISEAAPELLIEKADGSQWSTTYYRAYEGGCGKDAVIVLVNAEETEDGDKGSMRLSRESELLILENAKRCNNTIVVVRAGCAVDMSAWEKKVGAIVYAGFGGAMGNEALAAILMGIESPSGRLTATFAHTYEDYPVSRAYRTHAVNSYSEGLSVGYRYFDEHPECVLFPFGHGLSYADFEYSNIQISGKGEIYTVSFEIKNTSGIDAKEVSQVYVREINPHVIRPYKELKAFKKLLLRGGECVKVKIQLTKRDFAYYSLSEGAWVTKPGEFEILIGRSAHDIKLAGRVTI